MAKKSLNERLLELIQEHRHGDGKVRDWLAIADSLNNEGFLNAKGGTWTGVTIANRYQRIKTKKDVGMTQRYETGTTIDGMTEGDVSGMTEQEPLGMTEQSDSGMTDSGMTQSDSGTTVHGMTEQSDSGMTESLPGDQEQRNHTQQSESDHTDLDAMVTATVRRELQGLLKGVEIMPVQRAGRSGGSVTVKKAFSIPADVWAQVEALGGIMSNHVTAALRIYLSLKSGGKD